METSVEVPQNTKNRVAICCTRASRVGQVVKNHLPIEETYKMQVRSLGWEKTLEEGMATHSSILA